MFNWFIIKNHKSLTFRFHIIPFATLYPTISRYKVAKGINQLYSPYFPLVLYFASFRFLPLVALLPEQSRAE
jgi:hypothetical protein